MARRRKPPEPEPAERPHNGISEERRRRVLTDECQVCGHRMASAHSCTGKREERR